MGLFSSSETPLYWPQVVFFGDSLTEFNVHHPAGMQTYFSTKYRRQIDTVIRGLSGYNTEWAREVYPGIAEGLSKAPVRAIVVYFGANDAAAPSTSQHVPLENFKENLRWIGSKAQKLAETVIFVGVGVVNEDSQKEPDHEKPTRTNRDFYAYNRATKEIAEELKSVHFVDFWTLMRKQLGEDPNPENVTAGSYIGELNNPRNGELAEYLEDGLHYTNKSYEILCGEIDRVLNPVLSQLPLVPPYWMYVAKAGSVANYHKDPEAAKKI